MIDKYKIVLSRFNAELETPLDSSLRTLVTTEVDIKSEETTNNEDGTYDLLYKCKVVGSTIVKQGANKPVFCKSKRTQSQKLRQAIWSLNPDEEYYSCIMDKIIANTELVIDFLKDK